MKIEDIDPNSVRGQSYADAKENPGRVIKFQSEDGFSTVTYTLPMKGDEILEGLSFDPTPGFWYEAPVRDVTKVITDTVLGFRVKDILPTDAG
jgi:hypothetical protein